MDLSMYRLFVKRKVIGIENKSVFDFHRCRFSIVKICKGLKRKIPAGKPGFIIWMG
jgi:hypothetical protein